MMNQSGQGFGGFIRLAPFLWAISSPPLSTRRHKVRSRPTNARPGVISPYVTQANLQETACVVGWTRRIRPSSSYTNRVKIVQMRELNMVGDANNYHEDHLVPLCVGGHPRDQRNLRPQPVKGRWTAAVKDQFEASVCRAVCRGDMTPQVR